MTDDAELRRVVSALRQVVRNLRGETRGRASLSDDHFDEEAFARDAASFGSRLGQPICPSPRAQYARQDLNLRPTV